MADELSILVNRCPVCLTTFSTVSGLNNASFFGTNCGRFFYCGKVGVWMVDENYSQLDRKLKCIICFQLQSNELGGI